MAVEIMRRNLVISPDHPTKSNTESAEITDHILIGWPNEEKFKFLRRLAAFVLSSYAKNVALSSQPSKICVIGWSKKGEGRRANTDSSIDSRFCSDSWFHSFFICSIHERTKAIASPHNIKSSSSWNFYPLYYQPWVSSLRRLRSRLLVCVYYSGGCWSGCPEYILLYEYNILLQLDSMNIFHIMHIAHMICINIMVHIVVRLTPFLLL